MEEIEKKSKISKWFGNIKKNFVSKKQNANNPLVFDSVALAAQYFTDTFGLKIENSKDCIYKALKRNGKTHNFSVSKNEDNKIILELLRI